MSLSCFTGNFSKNRGPRYVLILQAPIYTLSRIYGLKEDVSRTSVFQEFSIYRL